MFSLYRSSDGSPLPKVNTEKNFYLKKNKIFTLERRLDPPTPETSFSCWKKLNQ